MRKVPGHEIPLKEPGNTLFLLMHQKKQWIGKCFYINILIVRLMPNVFFAGAAIGIMARVFREIFLFIFFQVFILLPIPNGRKKSRQWVDCAIGKMEEKCRI